MRLRSKNALYDFAFADNTASLTLLDTRDIPPDQSLLVMLYDPTTDLNETYWPNVGDTFRLGFVCPTDQDQALEVLRANGLVPEQEVN
jgi:hypothetical protein